LSRIVTGATLPQSSLAPSLVNARNQANAEPAHPFASPLGETLQWTGCVVCCVGHCVLWRGRRGPV